MMVLRKYREEIKRKRRERLGRERLLRRAWEGEIERRGMDSSRGLSGEVKFY